MTHLIIQQNIETRRNYLLEQINQQLQREFKSIAELHRIPDIHIVELTEKKSIGIDEIKKLQKEMIFQPFEEIYQVGIIFHADSLTIEAQNALLKTLEEVGERSLYFLVCANDQNLLDTIVSRSVKHYVKSDDTAELVEDESMAMPKYLGTSVVEKFQYIDELVTREKEDGVTVKEFFSELSSYLHNRFHIMTNANDETKYIREFIKKVDEANFRIKKNVNKQLALENLMLSIPKELEA